ncbi:hypothetical protein BamMEX5DRAFT_6636 [Burkholderia ambifaria MEX-5]|uniref:Uncharacterized protein n=1 Tax=Burkholderia ambifaria MEX-5 TaxID=396597 RepID=B1TFS0_9BURK|nr:hypothetical protein BamMEX5DRAFT_6636 [Burkholderia ambifaria MEX-5]
MVEDRAGNRGVSDPVTIDVQLDRASGYENFDAVPVQNIPVRQKLTTPSGLILENISMQRHEMRVAGPRPPLVGNYVVMGNGVTGIDGVGRVIFPENVSYVEFVYTNSDPISGCVARSMRLDGSEIAVTPFSRASITDILEMKFEDSERTIAMIEFRIREASQTDEGILVDEFRWS